MTQQTQPYQSYRIYPPAGPAGRGRPLSVGAVVGVALASLLLGGVGGVVLGQVSAGAGSQTGPGGGFGGPGGAQRGGFGPQNGGTTQPAPGQTGGN